MSRRKIGQVARQLLLSPRRLVEYERLGLIRPRREPSTGDRVFDDHDLEQLHRIRRFLDGPGLTLAALRTVLAYAPCWELTGCSQRAACPVPRDPFTPCYRQRSAGIATPCNGDCSRCPVFGSKETAREALVVCYSPPAAVASQAGGAAACVSGRECVRTSR